MTTSKHKSKMKVVLSLDHFQKGRSKFCLGGRTRSIKIKKQSFAMGQFVRVKRSSCHWHSLSGLCVHSMKNSLEWPARRLDH